MKITTRSLHSGLRREPPVEMTTKDPFLVNFAEKSM